MDGNLAGSATRGGILGKRCKPLMAVLAACTALAVANQAFAAVTTTLQLSSADPLNVPQLSYDATAGVVAVRGTFTLTGENGVTLAPAETGPATLTLTGFNPDGAAFTGVPNVILQDLITGTATFTLTDASSNVLLTGTATDAAFSISTGPTASGGVFSIGNIIYDSSPIFSDFLAAPDSFGNPGSFSFALTGFDSGQPSVTAGVLNSFTASIGGVYAATPSGSGSGNTPEPASLAILGVGAAALISRRRRA